MYLLGEVLQVVGARAKKWTQSEIIDKILERRQNENISAKRLKTTNNRRIFCQCQQKTKTIIHQRPFQGVFHIC